MMRLLLPLLIALAGPAAAQDAGPVYDPAILDACIAREGGADCIGAAADACMATEGGGTTIGIRECHGREAGQWDDMLNASYRQLTAGQDHRADALRTAQRAWIAYVDAACAYEAGAYEGGTLAGVVAGSCRMEQTAWRALDLRGYLAQEDSR